jgi:sugar phosphate isomerase/epimerase
MDISKLFSADYTGNENNQYTSAMKFSGRTQPLYPRYAVLDALQKIKNLGFDGVEICLEVDELRPDKLDDQTIAAIQHKMEALELSPVAVGYHVDYIYDDVLFELTKTAIRKTPAFGTDILIFSGTVSHTDDDAAWDRMVARTRQLVNLAETCGIRLAQEFEPGFIVGSTADMLRLFEAIPSSNLVANLDLGHVFLCDPDPLEAIRQLGLRIVHGHIENMATGVHNHLLPQEGDMDLSAYLKALKAVGFSGALALDLYQHDYEAVSPAVLEFLRDLLATI